jgi:hypothetical protein
VSPGGVAGGVVSQAPIRRRACVAAGAMTMCSGTGLLSQMIERGRDGRLMPRGERARGLATLLVRGAIVVLRPRWPVALSCRVPQRPALRAGGRRG